MLIVQKYGGSSVSTPEKILQIAKRLKDLHDQGEQLIVIVSAMGDTTDELVRLSRKITPHPVQREMDMLLSSGERISMALLAIAINSLGSRAISFTGSQSGVFTDGNHNNARIRDVKAFRVNDELNKGNIVIIAGFQGVDPFTKEVTTLGRGGSDTTAVAMAQSFAAARCEILKDVSGIYTVDPKIGDTSPKLLRRISYQTMLEMAYWGASVLHYRSVELAERSKVPIYVGLSSESDTGTVISEMEDTQVQAVNYNSDVALIKVDGADIAATLQRLFATLKEKGLSIPQVLNCYKSGSATEALITAPQENLASIKEALGSDGAKVDLHFGTVTITGRGLVNSNAIFEASELLKKNDIQCNATVSSPLSYSFVLEKTKLQEAARILHKAFVV